MKRKKDIIAKADELFDRVWYTRHTRDGGGDVHGRGASENAEDVRARFADRTGRDGTPLLDYDERWAGTLEGWLAAIRWVLDEEATENTDYLYDS